MLQREPKPMVKTTFGIKFGPESQRKYIYQKIDEADKNHLYHDTNKANDGRIYEDPGEHK